MKFGIGMFGDTGFDESLQAYRNPKFRLQELIEEVKFADALGIDVAVIGEHHREDYSVSSPEILLAALASVTNKIHLSSGVNVLSSADPVKLFQDYVQIDLISNNRAELMAGRGSFIESFPLFGQNLKDYNELFVEKLDLLLKLRRAEPLNWTGKFRPALVNQVVYPKPNRVLPVWIAVGGTPESVQRAAHLGLPIIFAIIGGSPSQFLPLIEYYKEEYRFAGHNPAEMEIGIQVHTYIADSKEKVLEEYYPIYARQMDKIGKERGWSGAYSRSQFETGMSQHGALFMGSSQDVAEKITQTAKQFGLTRFIAHIDVGGPSHFNQMQTIERFASEVIPQVKSALNLN